VQFWECISSASMKEPSSCPGKLYTMQAGIAPTLLYQFRDILTSPPHARYITTKYSASSIFNPSSVVFNISGCRGEILILNYNTHHLPIIEACNIQHFLHVRISIKSFLIHCIYILILLSSCYQYGIAK
jgi:hypothetical protein